MEIVICILVALLLLAMYRLIKEHKETKLAREELKKSDEELTRYIADNIDLEKRLASIEKDYERTEDMSKEIRNIQEQSRLLKHDMKNHTMVILSYLNEEKYEEAKEYTGKILNNLNKMYTYINVGNSLMNYILNSKLSKAKEMGIEVKAEIENLSFEYMESVDFSALLNNMLDNAIEAGMNADIKKIEVYVCKQKGFDSIMIKNAINESVLEKNPKLLSSKKESGHGFGVLQIKKVVEKYNGMIDIYEEDKEGYKNFVINVVCPS